MLGMFDIKKTLGCLSSQNLCYLGHVLTIDTKIKDTFSIKKKKIGYNLIKSSFDTDCLEPNFLKIVAFILSFSQVAISKKDLHLPFWLKAGAMKQKETSIQLFGRSGRADQLTIRAYPPTCNSENIHAFQNFLIQAGHCSVHQIFFSRSLQ